MLFFSFVVVLSLCLSTALGAWEEIVIPVPMLKGNKFSLPVQDVRTLFKELENLKAIWVMGKFKVGKSKLIDHIRKDGKETADALNNTIGIHAWVDKKRKVVLFDTEGIMQPVGENNIYFLKEFLINLMRRTADNFVFVTDQVDVVDLEFYKEFKNIFWNNDINQMYHVHNTKSLTEETLPVYKENIKELMGLDEDDVDMDFERKPIQHLFVPKLSDSGVYNFFMNTFGMNYQIDFIGNNLIKRGKLNFNSYMNAVDDSLLSLGSQALEVLADEQQQKTTVARREFHPTASELFPHNLKWCKEANGHHLRLYVATTDLIKISPSGIEDIAVTMNSLNKNFTVAKETVRIARPVPIIRNSDFAWECASTLKGYQVVRFKYVETPAAEKLLECPTESSLSFDPCDAYDKEIDEKAVENIRWDDIIAALNVVNVVGAAAEGVRVVGNLIFNISF